MKKAASREALDSVHGSTELTMQDAFRGLLGLFGEAFSEPLGVLWEENGERGDTEAPLRMNQLAKDVPPEMMISFARELVRRLREVNGLMPNKVLDLSCPEESLLALAVCESLGIPKGKAISRPQDVGEDDTILLVTFCCCHSDINHALMNVLPHDNNYRLCRHILSVIRPPGTNGLPLYTNIALIQ